MLCADDDAAVTAAAGRQYTCRDVVAGGQCSMFVGTLNICGIACGFCEAGSGPDHRQAFPFAAVAGTLYVLQVRTNLEAIGLFVLSLAEDGHSCDWEAEDLASNVIDSISDKSLGWTAPASGTFCVGVSILLAPAVGHATFSVKAVGTAVGRAPPANIAGAALPLRVTCNRKRCAFHYGGAAMLDGDGAGFELQLQAGEGVGYALEMQLAGGSTAAEVHLKIYYPGGVAGSSGFGEVLGGPLGDWIETPAGHHSYATYYGCANDDRICWNGQNLGASPTFGYHPGGRFGRRLTATWAAPAAGTALLRVAANCDSRFFADVEAEGCYMRCPGGDHPGDGYGCPHIASDGTYNDNCSADLTLTLTAGAYFATAESTQLTAEMFTPIPGAAVREITVEVGRSEIEQLTAEMFVPSPTLTAPPTLEQMLVPASEASVMLATMFTSQQQPHLVIPSLIEPIESSQLASEMFNPSQAQPIQTQPVCFGDAQTQGCQQEAECAVGMPTASCMPTQVSDKQVIGISREDTEQLAAEMFAANPPDYGMTTPPTLEQMLVPGSEASALLATMFTTDQQPHLVFPIAIEQIFVSRVRLRRIRQ
eukprot:SAG22_NODE_1156_length_5335_cov_2.046600_3_plen_592_part_01